MQGKQEAALALALRLKESKAEVAERWVKKAEALSFIGDDDGVLALLDEAKQAGELDQLNEVVWHRCAVAEYRKGDVSTARTYWQKCLKIAPYFSVAKDNLEELKKPQHERNCPQAFSLDAWLSRKTIESLTSTVERAARQKDDKKFQDKIRAHFDDHPEILHFVPAALASGDSLSRDLALKLADMSAHPALLANLMDFALGQQGSDALRLEASQLLTKHGVFTSGESVDLWLQGEWKPIMMMGFQIHFDAPEKPTLKPAAYRLMEQAIHALREENGANAEGFLRKAIEIQKDEPGLFNNLAVALGMQGKHKEAAAIADEILHRFPDYFFGQVIAVRKAIQANELEKAKTILDKMMKKQELHVTEFGALCACQIDFMIVDDKPEGAISWFEMWEKGYPDDPALERYEEQIAMTKAMLKLKDGFPRSRRKDRKSSK
jgi:tetratricopeptide (TPR) repeat protein